MLRGFWRVSLALVVLVVGIGALTDLAGATYKPPIRERYVSPNQGLNGFAEICGLSADEALTLQHKINTQLPGHETQTIPDIDEDGSWCVLVFDLSQSDIDFIRSLVRELRPACYVDGYGTEPLPNFSDQGSCEGLAHGWWGVPSPDWNPDTGTYVPQPVIRNTVPEDDCTMYFWVAVAREPARNLTLELEYAGQVRYVSVPAGVGVYEVASQFGVTMSESTQRATVLESARWDEMTTIHDI